MEPARQESYCRSLVAQLCLVCNWLGCMLDEVEKTETSHQSSKGLQSTTQGWLGASPRLVWLRVQGLHERTPGGRGRMNLAHPSPEEGNGGTPPHITSMCGGREDGSCIDFRQSRKRVENAHRPIPVKELIEN